MKIAAFLTAIALAVLYPAADSGPKYEVKEVLTVTVSKVTPSLQEYLRLKDQDKATTVKFVLEVAATGNEDFTLVRSSDFALTYVLNGKQKKADCFALGIKGVLWNPKNPESDLILAKRVGQPIEMNMNMKLTKELLVMFVLVDDVSVVTLKHKRPEGTFIDIKAVTLDQPAVKTAP